MKPTNYILRGLANAGLTIAYISIVALILSNAQNIFGPEEPKSILVPIFMLTFFVMSAAITGSLVIGKPILLYLSGEKKEAITLFAITIGWLAVFWIIAAGMLVLS